MKRQACRSPPSFLLSRFFEFESLDSFLDDITRVTSRDYEPSDKDVLKARLRTVGVQEYKFTIEKGCFVPTNDRILKLTNESILGAEIGRDWKMFDVGGTRTSVRPFF